MSKQEQLAQVPQEEAQEAPQAIETHEEISTEKVSELAESKETALTELKERSAKETAGFETGFASSAQSLGGTPEDIAPVTAQIEQLEMQKEATIDGARQEISAEAQVEAPQEMPGAITPEQTTPTQPEAANENDPKIPKAQSEKAPGEPILKERIVQTPEQHQAAIAELQSERVATRDKIAEMQARATSLQHAVEAKRGTVESSEKALDDLRKERDERANSLVGKIKDMLLLETPGDQKMHERVANQWQSIDATKEELAAASQELEATTNALIDADETLKAIDAKIEGTERNQASVDQIMLRNKAFFVHTIREDDLRHNVNSSMSRETSFEDDLDMLLALEPSVSASTMVPGADAEGRISGIWGGEDAGGVLLGGGRVSQFSHEDAETVSTGIQARAQKEMPEESYEYIPKATTVEGDAASWKDKLDAAATNRGGWLGVPHNTDKSYNEFVVNAPEAVGYFKAARVDEKGRFWITSDAIKHGANSMVLDDPNRSTHEAYLAAYPELAQGYRERMNFIQEKGLPFYAMTPDRRFFAVNAVNDDGSLEVGAELTPEEAASGRAGLSAEKRKEVGQKLLERDNRQALFKSKETRSEAEQILSKI